MMGGLKVVTKQYELFRIAGSLGGSESLRETATTATAGDSTLSLQQVAISIFSHLLVAASAPLLVACGSKEVEAPNGASTSLLRQVTISISSHLWRHTVDCGWLPPAAGLLWEEIN